MSTITVTNIKATGETASRAVLGIAPVWINFNGTGTPSTTKSQNTSSITDNGTGQYHVAITNAMADANFAALGSVIGDSTGTNRVYALVASRDANTTTRISINTAEANAGSTRDWTHISAAVLGDLA